MLDLIRIFLKLGLLGFGGPPAHIAMMEDECVTKRKWLTPERFAQGLALCNLLPGPASTQLAIWIGYERRRYLGAIVSGLLFIIPSFVMVIILAAIYQRYGKAPSAQALLYGIKPAVIGVILSTCWRLSQPIRKDRIAIAIFVVITLLTLIKPEYVAIYLVTCGIIGLYLYKPDYKKVAVHLWPLFLYFLKTGSLIFGGGFVLIPLLQADLVERLHWLSARQFLDAVAVGQVTPGPVVITSAFIGYLLYGIKGAAVAAAGMFLPSFILIFITAPAIQKYSSDPRLKRATKAITPAVIGAILAASWPLLKAVIQPQMLWNTISLLIVIVSITAVVRYKINTGIVVVASGIVGLIMKALLT